MKPGKSKKCLLGTLTYIFVLLLLLFMLIFVIIPIVFKYSTEIQRSLIFPTWSIENVDFSKPENFGIEGVRNFYVTVNENENITLGIWQILPTKALHNDSYNHYYDYEAILANKEYNIIVYLHGNGGVRAYPLELYAILREKFHIIAVDYRGYGDSTKAELTEDNIVNDIVRLCKWLRGKTEARIFFWGHSLGTGIGTHVVSNLKAQDFVPSGLVLEAPFSSVPDVMETHLFLKLMSWLPWYRTTMLDPIVSNGFAFESTKYILDVDCPIMILHAKDDNIIPYELATKLYETANKHRNLTIQGNVTYHLFGEKGYNHMWIFLAPRLPKYISNFVDVCLDFEKKSLNGTN